MAQSSGLSAVLVCGEHIAWVHADAQASAQVRLIEPGFAEEYRGRALQIARRQQWKQEGSGAQFARGGPAFGDSDTLPVAASVRLVDVARDSKAGCFVYAVLAEKVSGLFRVDPETGQEQRLYHSNECRISSIGPSLRDGVVVCSVANDRGACDLALVDVERGGITELTEGDSVDEAPAWVQSSSRRMVFQSAGIARDKNGFVAAVGPRSIQQLDTASGELEEMLSDEGHDLLCPRLLADGTLLFLRRPWQQPKGPSALAMARSLVMFPFHFFMALFNVVDALTRGRSKTPLLPAGPSRSPESSKDPLWLWGALVQQTEKPGTPGSEDCGLVPKNWELVRRDPRGEQTVLARGVVSFALGERGAVLYTNGKILFEREANGQSRRLAKVPGATRVVRIDP